MPFEKRIQDLSIPEILGVLVGLFVIAVALWKNDGDRSPRSEKVSQTASASARDGKGSSDPLTIGASFPDQNLFTEIWNANAKPEFEIASAIYGRTLRDPDPAWPDHSFAMVVGNTGMRVVNEKPARSAIRPNVVVYGYFSISQTQISRDLWLEGCKSLLRVLAPKLTDADRDGLLARHTRQVGGIGSEKIGAFEFMVNEDFDRSDPRLLGDNPDVTSVLPVPTCTVGYVPETGG